MAEPVKFNIETYQGDRYELFFRIREREWDQELNDGEGDWVLGDYIDLSGHTPSGKIKLNREQETPITATFDCHITNQVTIKGGVIAVLLPVQSKLLTEKKYVYDIQTKIDAEHINTWLTGNVKNTAQVDDSE